MRTPVDLNLKELYKYYCNRYEKPVKEDIFNKVTKAINKKIKQKLYEGFIINLSYGLGCMYVMKYKPDYKFTEDGEIDTKGTMKMINWKETNKLWEKYPEFKKKKFVCYDNIHTDGYMFKLVWKHFSTCHSLRVYNFAPARGFSRDLNEYILRTRKLDYNDN